MSLSPPEARPICLDLCAGLGGFSEGFLRRGWRVLRVDNSKQFRAVPHMIISDLTMKATRERIAQQGPFDAVVTGPPCERFSVTVIGRNWTKDHQPRNPVAKAMRELALTVHDYIIDDLKPRYFAIENPRAKLRRLYELHRNLPPLDETWWCQWRDSKGPAKPTDIFSHKDRFPKSMLPLPKCRNGATDHDRATRGTDIGGTLDRNTPPEVRALIPIKFSLTLAEAIEMELGIKAMAPQAPVAMTERRTLEAYG